MISAKLLSPAFQWAAWPFYTAVIGYAVLKTPWVEWANDTRRQNITLGAVLCLFLLWMVQRPFESGFSIHLLGMTVVTLLLDWPLAMLAGFVAQLALVLVGRQELFALGTNGLLLVMMPVVVTRCIATAVERRQPTNLFVYIFLCGFFPAALTAFLYALCCLALLWMDGAILPSWFEDFPIYMLLILFPEGFINGTVISALVVYYPEWLETFNRTRYLQVPLNEHNGRSGKDEGDN